MHHQKKIGMHHQQNIGMHHQKESGVDPNYPGWAILIRRRQEWQKKSTAAQVPESLEPVYGPRHSQV